MLTNITRKAQCTDAHCLPLAYMLAAEQLCKLASLAERCLDLLQFWQSASPQKYVYERCLSVFAALHRTARQLCREYCLRRCTAESSESSNRL